MTRFSDYLILTGKVHENFGELFGWAKASVRYIRNGGDPYHLIREKDGWAYRKVLSRTPVNFQVRVNDRVKHYTMADIVREIAPRISYQRADFLPYLDNAALAETTHGMDLSNKYRLSEGEVFNLFDGYLHAYDPDFLACVKMCEPIIRHLREVWCGGDEEACEYLLNYFAHIVQKPREKMGVAVVLRAARGAGRSIMLDFLSRKVLGEKYCMYTCNVNHLTREFGTLLERKLLITLDCPDKDSLHESIISREHIEVNRGDEGKVTVKDFSNIFVTTDHHWSERGDCFVLECSNGMIGDKRYFADLAKRMDRNTGWHFFQYLADRDIEQWNWKPASGTRG